MVLDNYKQKNLSQDKIKFILNLFNLNKFIEAKKEIHAQLIIYPSSAILYNILGAIFAGENEFNEAIKNYEKAIQLNPSYAQAYNNLGNTLYKLNKIDESIHNYKKAIKYKNDFAEAYNNLGNANIKIYKLKEAIQYFEKSLKFKNDYAEAYYNLGLAYLELDKRSDSIKFLEKAIKVRPEYAEAYYCLGIIFNDLARFDDSLFCYKKAIKLEPQQEKFYNNLGNLLNKLGEYDEAEKEFYKAIQIKPNYSKAYSNLLFNLSFKLDFDSNLYLKEAKNFALNCKPINKQSSFKYQYIKKPQKLKLGFVSSNFYGHPGAYFTLSTFKELKKKNFDLIAYSCSSHEDEYSNQLKRLFSDWHNIEDKNYHDIVKQINNDGIHILVDMQGHSDKNKLPLFILKAAPIQITWLGQGTSGISEIDYFIGDNYNVLKEEEKNYVEKVLRLPEISQCFTPPDFNIKIKDLPAIKNNYITFGCINRLEKINEEVISLWSKILLSVPNSKLLLKNRNLDNIEITNNVLNKFKKNGIEKNRLILLGQSITRKEALETYNKIDIALDTFPFQGNTTSCESIWMGVPVITLKGDRHLFHFGESINSNLNMSDWVAKNKEDYIKKAIKFASSFEKLSEIRKSLRKIFLESPLCDAPRFVKHFSKLFWEMWKKFER